MEKYKLYTTKDFLNDPLFSEWQLLATQELANHWQKVIKIYPDLAPSMEEAKLTFKKYLSLNKYQMSKNEAQDLFAKIVDNKQRNFTPKRNIFIYIKVALSVAAIALLFVVSNLLFENNIPDTPNTSLIVHAQLPPIDEIKEIQLISMDSTIILQDNVELTYNQGKENQGKVGQNTLIVPYGKRSTIILSDGTKVWVNSGTSITYPAAFAAEGPRTIIVDGEIYLEVKKDNNRPFRVKSALYEVEVLGTSFNISAYSTDSKSSVVLVEGSVQINKAQEKIKVQPNQMYTQSGNTSELKKVNVNNYTSWRNGWLQFDNLPLEDLATRLTRYYGKNITCDPKISKLPSSGKLLLVDDLEQLLKVVSENMNITYTEKDKTIHLTSR